MKTAKRIFAMMLAVLMVAGLCSTAFAANSNPPSEDRGSITITNPIDGEDYTAYRIFDLTYDAPNTSGVPVNPLHPAHDASCYNCGFLAHTHSDACYDLVNDPSKTTPICGLTEHTHGDTCCKLAEHTHGTACYNSEGELICKIPEHTHGTGCEYLLCEIDPSTYDLGNPYYYSVKADSPFYDLVEGYILGCKDTDPTYDGLQLNPVYKNDDPTAVEYYNVSFGPDFSPADFAEKMKTAIDTELTSDPTTFDSYKAEFVDDAVSGKPVAKDLLFGYWLVMPSTGALCTLTSTDPDVQVSDKNEAPPMDKVIVVENPPTPTPTYPDDTDPAYTAYELFQKNSRWEWGEDIDADAFVAAAMANATLKAAFEDLTYNDAEYNANPGDSAAQKWYELYKITAYKDIIEGLFADGACIKTGATGKNALNKLSPNSLYLVKKLPSGGTATYDVYSADATGMLPGWADDTDTFLVKPELVNTTDLDQPNGEADANTGNIGDTIQYKLTTKVPDMTGYEQYFFVVNDTMDKSLTYLADTLTVEIGGKNQTKKPLTKDTDYTVYVEEVKDTTGEVTGTNVKIVFTDMVGKYYSNDSTKDWTGEPVVVTYKAFLNDSAKIVDPNSNEAHVDYSNNPNFKPETIPGKDLENPDNPFDPAYKHNEDGYTGDKPTGEGPKDETRTYVAEIEITKKDDKSGILTGAKFSISGLKHGVIFTNKEIFKEDTNGTYYKLKDGTYTQNPPSASTKKYEKVTPPFTEFVEFSLVENDMFYKVEGGTEYIEVTEENKDSIPADAKLYYYDSVNSKYVGFDREGKYYKDATSGAYVVIGTGGTPNGSVPANAHLFDKVPTVVDDYLIVMADAGAFAAGTTYYTLTSGTPDVLEEVNLIGKYYSTDSGATFTLITSENVATIPAGAALYDTDKTTVLDPTAWKTATVTKITKTMADGLADTDWVGHLINVGHGIEDYDNVTTKYSKVTEVTPTTDAETEKFQADGYVDSTGKLVFSGLAEGTYTVEELVAPDGYNKLTAPITVVITFVYDEDDVGHFEATVDGQPATAEKDTSGKYTNKLQFDVINKQGVELPETGGIGTYLFYTIGGLLVVAAGVLLITKKRMRAGEIEE